MVTEHHETKAHRPMLGKIKGAGLVRGGSQEYWRKTDLTSQKQPKAKSLSPARTVGRVALRKARWNTQQRKKSLRRRTPFGSRWGGSHSLMRDLMV